MARYGKSSQRSVRQAIHKLKKGTLKSGRSGSRVTSREQAVAIGLSEARRKGAKVLAKKIAGSSRTPQRKKEFDDGGKTLRTPELYLPCRTGERILFV